MSKFRTAFLSFIASELFILIIELTFGIPLNVYYYMDLNLTKTTDVTLPLFLSSDERTDPAEGSVFLKSVLSILLRFLTSPALLIAIVVYVLAPDDENSPGLVSHI